MIFIHIDDNEASNLRKMCDEIFGEENFVANVVWQKRTSPDARLSISSGHEYVLIYVKNVNCLDEAINLLSLTDEQKAAYKNPDNDPRGPWVSSDFTAQIGHATPQQFYTIKSPSGKEFTPPQGTCWKNIEPVYLQKLAEGRFWFGKDGDAFPRRKTYLCETRGRTVWTWWSNKEVGHTQEASKELKDLLNNTSVFDNPKPVRLIKRMLQMTTKQDSIILDFFSGSATTAHSVLDLNKQDNGNRKFIMVQLPEPCAEDSEAFKAGYKTIADIGKERIRRVIKKLNHEIHEKHEKEKNSQPSIFNSEASDSSLSCGSCVSWSNDLGFKVLKLDKSNFKQWQKLAPDATPEQIEQQLFDHIDHIDHKATPEDLLFEILIKAGFMPTEKVQTITLAGIPVFSIADGGLLICLADTVTKELINAVAEAEPMQFICLDKAFGGNDQLKANAVQTFNARNMGKEKHNQIIFRTV